MKAKLVKHFSRTFPEGSEFEIDLIRHSEHMVNGYEVRVVGTKQRPQLKKPQWWNIDWFAIDSEDENGK